jgi:RNA polymerase sigma factor (TIGR02999 family)
MAFVARSGDAMSAPGVVTGLVRSWRSGESGAQAALTHEIYATLKRMARGRLGGASPATLNPTALVHEAVARMLDAQADFQSRAHFFALAALQMRAVLVDHARKRGAERRGGGEIAITLDEDLALVAGDDAFLDLHEALNALAQADPRTARTIELTYFGGMSAAQVGEVSGVSVATVERDLAFGRAWLKRTLRA